MTLSAIRCPADYMQSKKEISPLIQLPKLCANKKAKAFGDPTAGPFPQLASAVLVLHVTEQTPRNCNGWWILFPEMTRSVWHNSLGWRGPRGWPHPKPHSKQGLFRRDPATQGRGGWPKDADPTALDRRALPASLADLSRALGSDLPSFVLSVLLKAPLLALHVRASVEPQWGDKPHPAEYRCQIWNFCHLFPLFSSLPQNMMLL